MIPPIPSKFFSIFWDNEACREIFLMHKEQLLEKNEIDFAGSKKNFYLQRIVLSNSLRRSDTDTRMQQRIQNRSIDLDHSLSLKAQRNFTEPKIDAYFQEKFGKSIKSITDKLNGGNISQIRFLSELTTSLLSEKRILKFLKKYNFISSKINSIKELGEFIEKSFEAEISKTLNSGHLLDIITSMDEISDYYNNEIFNSLIDANQFYTDRIYDKENFKDRIALFDLLYEANVLIGGKYKTYYECTSCATGVFSGNMTLNVTPGKVKLKCPNCAKEVFFLAPYQICNDVFNMLVHKDGLLFFAIGYLLKKKQLKFVTNQFYIPDIEIDFQILNLQNQITDIIEIKNFKTDRPDDTQITNLRDGLKRFLDSRNKLINSNPSYSEVKFHFVTNLRTEVFYNKLKEAFKEELSNTFIKVYSPEGFKQQFKN